MVLCLGNNNKERIVVVDRETGNVILTVLPYEPRENQVKIRFEAEKRYNIHREKV